MANPNDEVERYKRIRDQQLQARDPQKGERKIHRSISTRQRKSRKSFSFQEMISDLPRKWSGLFVGAVLGFIVFVFLPLLISQSWVDLLGLAIMFFLAFIGFAIGQAADSKREIEELIRK